MRKIQLNSVKFVKRKCPVMNKIIIPIILLKYKLYYVYVSRDAQDKRTPFIK